MLNIACCLVVELGMDLVSCWLVVMHTYLFYFPLSLSLSCHDMVASASNLVRLCGRCCGREAKINWTKTAHDTRAPRTCWSIHTRRCVVTDWARGLLKVSACGGRVLGHSRQSATSAVASDGKVI